jgi:hypothetical protein
MKAPQIIIIVIYAANLLMAAHIHGKQESSKRSFWTSLLADSIILGLLIWGGFFK